MTSLHEYSKYSYLASWIFKITYNGIFKKIKIPMRSLQYLNHHVTSWIFWIKKPRCMGILNILYLKLACSVCYLKIKTFFRNIMHVQGTQRWHWNRSNRTINQNSENNVLINNLGTAWPIQIFNAIFWVTLKCMHIDDFENTQNMLISS